MNNKEIIKHLNEIIENLNDAIDINLYEDLEEDSLLKIQALKQVIKGLK